MSAPQPFHIVPLTTSMSVCNSCIKRMRNWDKKFKITRVNVCGFYDAYVYFFFFYRFGIGYIDKANNYFDVDSWLRSSVKNIGWTWTSRKMSLSRNYGWIPEGGDNDPFLQLDMGQPYQVIGLYLQTHYISNDEPLYFITSYNVKYSHDETSFVYVGMNLPVVCKPGFDNSCFDNSTDSRGST